MTTTCLIGVDVTTGQARRTGAGWALAAPTAPAAATTGATRAAAPRPASARRAERFMVSPLAIVTAGTRQAHRSGPGPRYARAGVLQRRPADRLRSVCRNCVGPWHFCQHS